MRKGLWAICWAAVSLSAGSVHAQTSPNDAELPGGMPRFNFVGDNAAPALLHPLMLAVGDDPASVYPEIMPAREDEGINSGGVNVGLDVNWMSDYIYRGINQSSPGRRHENALQFDTSAQFDLGKLPHPFIGLFVNVFNSDPVSRFEEVRPYFGLDWTIKPIEFVGGFTSYIFPNRKNLDTQEVFGTLTFDDSVLFHSAKPIFSPYVHGAYDISLYNGFYLEAGIKHDFVFEDFGVTLTPHGDVAYVIDQTYFEGTGPMARDFGLQHFDVGLTGALSLNHFFNVNRRYGEFSVRGFLTYSGRIDKELRANTLIWGGVGLEFRY